MSRIRSARLPLDPLLAASGCVDADEGGRHAPLAALARVTGTSRRQIQRWQRDGIPLHSADAAACGCGLHPAEVWGDAWWEACARQDLLEEEAPLTRAEIVAGYQALERHRDRRLRALERLRGHAA